jgi:hypothetical protein
MKTTLHCILQFLPERSVELSNMFKVSSLTFFQWHQKRLKLAQKA